MKETSTSTTKTFSLDGKPSSWQTNTLKTNYAKKTLHPREIKTLETHSQMLTQISNCVNPFYPFPNSTTLEGVLSLLEAYHTAKAEIPTQKAETHNQKAKILSQKLSKLQNLRTFGNKTSL